MVRAQHLTMMMAGAGGALSASYIWCVKGLLLCCAWCCDLYTVIFVQLAPVSLCDSPCDSPCAFSFLKLFDLSSLPWPLPIRLPSFERAKELQPRVEERQARLDALKAAQSSLTTAEFAAQRAGL
jgi:hypothetical protein